jgi:26S proteasome regulatory subunit N2
MKYAESDKDSVEIDPRLEEIVEIMLDKCMLDGKFQ